MQRANPFTIRSMVCAILALLISGCASSNPPLNDMPGISQSSSGTPSRTTPARRPSALLTPEFTPTNPDAFQSTATVVAEVTLIGSPSPASAKCSAAEIDQYLNVVLPLADEHTVDSYEAQKMGANTDGMHLVELRQRAIIRLESIRKIQAPPCLQEAHAKLTGSFELLSSTWNLIEAKDYSTATTALKKCYENLVDAVAMIAMIKQK